MDTDAKSNLAQAARAPGIELVDGAGGLLCLRLTGSWRTGQPHPSADEVAEQIKSRGEVARLALDATSLDEWDSGLLTFLIKIVRAHEGKVLVEREGLPRGVNRLLDLALAVPERTGARKERAPASLLARIGEAARELWGSSLQLLAFVGEITVALFRLLTGRARFRRSDLLVVFQEASAGALPIVSLISLLVGLILAFVGAIQLRPFGAQIYVADLVGIGMTRAMGAIMTGIIMAGRTGASFAAQLGTMQVNEEIDALQTTGISAMDFLVLPRLLALGISMPLLTLYSDLMGILGGFLVGVTGLELSPIQYYQETKAAVSLTNLWIGLFSGFVFGILVAVAGCMRGIQCGRSASAVGDATTSAVVTSIVSIVVATAVITVVCDLVGI